MIGFLSVVVLIWIVLINIFLLVANWTGVNWLIIVIGKILCFLTLFLIFYNLITL